MRSSPDDKSPCAKTDIICSVHMLRIGIEAHRVPLDAVVQVVSSLAETVRSSFGPFCLDKVVTNDLGHVIVTSHGASILECLEVANPLGRMVLDAARARPRAHAPVLWLRAVLTPCPHAWQGLSSHDGDGSIALLLMVEAAARQCALEAGNRTFGSRPWPPPQLPSFLSTPILRPLPWAPAPRACCDPSWRRVLPARLPSGWRPSSATCWTGPLPAPCPSLPPAIP